MIVPPSVLKGVEAVLEAHSSSPIRVEGASPLGGGCINPSAKLEASDGNLYFLKWNPHAPSEMFISEADGLRALAKPGFLRVPEVLGQGGEGPAPNPSWLLLEFIPQGRPGPQYGQKLGQGLADLHGSALTGPDPDVTVSYGWSRDNFIGSLPQDNGPKGNWTSFWRDQRLVPQLRMARDRGHFTGPGGKTMDRLLSQLDKILADVNQDGPALLHGDLWSGNYYPGPAGEPVLIDPAVYRGAREVDLAMMELFGRFPRGFEEGYGSRRKLAPEYALFRRDLYQLYYLLVHVNLFGGSYESGSLAAAEGALRGS